MKVRILLIAALAATAVFIPATSQAVVPWSGTVVLSASTSTVDSSNPRATVVMSESESLPSGYAQTIYDESNRLVGVCTYPTVQGCYATVTIPFEATKTYTAYISKDYPMTGPPADVYRTAGPVTITHLGWLGTAQFTASAGTVDASHPSSTLTLTLSQSLPSDYTMAIYDEAHHLVRSCTYPYVSGCSVTVQPAAGLAKFYTAYVAHSAPAFGSPAGVLLESGAVGVVSTAFNEAAAIETLAASAASMIDPCVELFPIAPRTNGTSLNDAQYLCETNRNAGKSWQFIIDAVAAAYGTDVLIRATVAVNDGGAQVGAPPRPVDPSPAPQPPATPVHTMPSFDDQLITDGGSRIQNDRQIVTGYGYATDPQPETSAKTVYAQCLRFANFAGSGITRDDCETMPIFAPGADVAQAADHDFDVVYATPAVVQLAMLSRVEKLATDGLPRSWYQRAAYISYCPQPTEPGSQCDEYPFYTSEQGGPLDDGVSLYPHQLQAVNASDNMLQGTLLHGFYQVCGIAQAPQGSHDRKFLVIPIPEQEGIPTTAYCALPNG